MLRTTTFLALTALLFHLSLCRAQSLPAAGDQLFSCLDEGTEYTKMGLFFSLGTDKKIALSPARFSTGVSEERRKEIVEEIYGARPDNYRSYARQVFMRCVAQKVSPYSSNTLDYCFSLQVRLIEFFVARDGAVTEAELLRLWKAEMQSRPDVLPWGVRMIQDIYVSKKSLPELAPWAFIGCAEARYRGERRDGN